MHELGWVIGYVTLVALLAYQEKSWRVRQDGLVEQYERRMQEQVELAHKLGLAQASSQVRSFTFKHDHKKVAWRMFKSERTLYISVTFVGKELKYMAGDLSEIEKFEMPPEIKAAIIAAIKAAGGMPPLP